jgi:hypothetical protein
VQLVWLSAVLKHCESNPSFRRHLVSVWAFHVFCAFSDNFFLSHCHTCSIFVFSNEKRFGAFAMNALSSFMSFLISCCFFVSQLFRISRAGNKMVLNRCEIHIPHLPTEEFHWFKVWSKSEANSWVRSLFYKNWTENTAILGIARQVTSKWVWMEHFVFGPRFQLLNSEGDQTTIVVRTKFGCLNALSCPIERSIDAIVWLRRFDEWSILCSVPGSDWQRTCAKLCFSQTHFCADFQDWTHSDIGETS